MCLCLCVFLSRTAAAAVNYYSRQRPKSFLFPFFFFLSSFSQNVCLSQPTKTSVCLSVRVCVCVPFLTLVVEYGKKWKNDFLLFFGRLLNIYTLPRSLRAEQSRGRERAMKTTKRITDSTGAEQSTVAYIELNCYVFR